MAHILTAKDLNPNALNQQVAMQQMMAMRVDDMYVRAASEIMAGLCAAAVPRALADAESGKPSAINYEFFAEESVMAATALMRTLGINVKPRTQPTRTMHDAPLEENEGEATDRYTNQD